MLRYLGFLVVSIAALSACESFGVAVSPGAVGVAAGFVIVLWLNRKKRTTG